ncbi:efflux RND transporter periplasmic adaptor subunit [Serratia plymuthica]|uniref:Secretion protein HlyD n=2 Tax=Serratia plymuthica TaxID=82996 RepID=S4YXS0_SERPL|nr:HlyD family efflux transporter periplasmic adaptor subunit [Serratia plymuthica]AGP47358.1 secretion protein HlyD [Serratia plymuthica S13]AHY09213.1 secretion protein HlyD [Serratia plymuthica]ANJ94154.1 secretion protein HlyD [Serratia plymuthica]ANK00430.1 secretion protein HlyD [Serratia plymuthica]EKF62300.1 secretion HlyD family protein [Serratia plymuthica A30]
MKNVLRLCLLAMSLALSLSGCDDTPIAAAATATPSPWAAVAKGYISIEGGLISIDAPRPGIIKEILVEEGAVVKKGQLLARIEDNEALDALNIKIKQQIEAVRDLEWAQQKLTIATREFNRLAKLNTTVISAQEHDNAADQMVLQQRELAMKKATLETANAGVKAAELEVEKYLVVAPADGRIVKRDAKPGEGASTLNVTRLFMLAPNAPRIVRAELEDVFVNAVQPGQHAEVTLENNDKRIYKAQVLRLSEVFGARQPTDDPNVNQDTRVIECVLTLDAPQIRIGQRVLVRILPADKPDATAREG